MRSMISACLFALIAMASVGGPAAAEKVRCSAIRDSAMCVSEPTCWYDAANNKGCLEGPRPGENACGVHGGESICNTSTLGCMWDAGGKKCVGKPN